MTRRHLASWIVVGAMASVLSGTSCEPADDATPVTPGAPIERVVQLGSGGHDQVRDIAIGADGSLFLVGGVEGAGLPVSPGAAQQTHGGDMDAFAARLTPEGELVWLTYLGGPGHDRAYAVAIDANGDAVVAGRAGEGAPVTEGAFQTGFVGGPSDGPYGPTDGYVAKLSGEDGSLLWGSYFGALDPPNRIIRDLDLTADGDIVVASSTTGAHAYPAAIAEAFERGEVREGSGPASAVVARIAADGTRVRWATRIGGSGAFSGQPAVRVGPDGAITYLSTTDGDAPTSAGAFDRSHAGDLDFYLLRLSAAGRFEWATFLGGTGMEDLETNHLAIAPNGDVVVGAGTTSSDFPTTEGAFSTVHAGNGGPGTGQGTNYPGDAVLARLSADGRRLLAATFYGGRFGEFGEGVAVDSQGRAHLTGATFSPDLPTTADAVARGRKARHDGFYAVFSPGLDRLLYGSYLGAEGGTDSRAIAVDAADGAWVGGALYGGGVWLPAKLDADDFAGGSSDATAVWFAPPSASDSAPDPTP